MIVQNYKTLSKYTKQLRILVVFIVLLAGLYTWYQSTYIHHLPRTVVTLNRCVDGDTANFKEVGTTRFLMIDTPETDTDLGQEASNFTCNLLTKATIIEIAYDDHANRTDRFDRTLAWIFVDGQLLQAKIGQAGYISRFFDYRGRATFNVNEVGLNQDYVNEVYSSLKKDNSAWQGQ